MHNRQVLIGSVLLVALAGGLVLWHGQEGRAAQLPPGMDLMTPVVEGDWVLGLVRDGKLQVLAPEAARLLPPRFTAIPMQAAQPPEAAELDLTPYEGSAIMVAGHDGGGWFYSANVVDRAGPILTAVVQETYRTEEP